MKHFYIIPINIWRGIFKKVVNLVVKIINLRFPKTRFDCTLVLWFNFARLSFPISLFFEQDALFTSPPNHSYIIVPYDIIDIIYKYYNTKNITYTFMFLSRLFLCFFVIPNFGISFFLSVLTWPTTLQLYPVCVLMYLLCDLQVFFMMYTF